MEIAANGKEYENFYLVCSNCALTTFLAFISDKIFNLGLAYRLYQPEIRP